MYNVHVHTHSCPDEDSSSAVETVGILSFFLYWIGVSSTPDVMSDSQPQTQSLKMNASLICCVLQTGVGTLT